MKALIALTLMSSVAMAGERATIVVCPPALSYCYHEDRPVLPKMSTQDAVRAIRQEMADDLRRIEDNSKRVDDDLDYALTRSYLLRR